VGKLVPGIVALQGRFLQLLKFSGKLRRVGGRLLKITLRKNKAGLKKNKYENAKRLQSALQRGIGAAII
jgi:hypothetical protein